MWIMQTRHLPLVPKDSFSWQGFGGSSMVSLMTEVLSNSYSFVDDSCAAAH